MNGLMIQLSAFADQWAAWCASGLIGATLVLVVISVVALPIWKNRSPQLLGILFFLVLLKPFVPIEIALPHALSSRLADTIGDHPPSPSGMQTATAMPLPSSNAAHPIATQSVDAIDIDAAMAYAAMEHATAPLAPPLIVAESQDKIPSASIAWSPWLIGLVLYAGVIAFLLMRCAIIQLRFHRLVSQSSSLSALELPFDFSAACHRAGLSQEPRLIELQTGSPAVWGLIRTTLILPTGMIQEMSTESLRWAIMHELAHVKRHDIVMHALQKLLTLVQFWNPAVWFASAMIDRFREQSCDDMALLWSDRQSVSAGEAFMHVVRNANQMPMNRPLAASLGVFSSGNKRVCADRLRRILDSDRPLRDRMSMYALLFLLISSVTLLPNLRAGAEPQVVTEAAVQTADADTAFVAAKDVGQFELQLVGPENEAIPFAEVEIRPKSDQPWKILVGSFERDAQYGTYTKTDAEGRLVIQLPTELVRDIQFSIKAPGYGLFWAQWRGGDKSEVMPSRYVAHLDKGQNVGGIIVDESGKPVVGAQVHPSIEYKKRESDESQLSTGWSAKTDDQGHWNCNFVPADYEHLSVEVVHDDFVPTAMKLELPKYLLVAGNTAREPMVIDRGITLTGKITDQDGNPIADAAIRSVLVNETRITKSDADGNYRLLGFPSGSHAVTVTAAKRSPEQKVVLFEKGMKAVDITLQPGRTVRVRVVDAQGNPQSKARIFFRNWRDDNYGRGLGMVHAYTDEHGIWEWNEAPADAFVADVCPVGCVTIGDQVFTARQQEYLFTATKQLQIVGTVIDAADQQPIPSFRIVPGLVWQDATEALWIRNDSFDSRDGSFTLSQDRRDARHAIRVEAAGYQPATSRFIDVNEGRVELKFELQATHAISVQIDRPDGSPAAGAQAAIGIAGAQVGVQSGEFTNTYAQQLQVDLDGVLRFPPDAAPIRLVILDKTGYADVVIEPESVPAKISLIAWATVQGTLLHGKRPAANEWLTLSPHQSAPSTAVINLNWRDRVQADDQGRFQFDRVRPGVIDLFQEIHTHDTGRMSLSAISSRMQFSIESAEMKTIDIGGNGFAVTAHASTQWAASPSADDPQVDWEFSTLSIKPVVDEGPTVPYPAGLTDEQKSTWYETWQSTAAGIALAKQRNEHFLQSIQSYGCKVDSSGKIRVDDLAPGKYVLSLVLDSRPSGPGYAYVRLGEAKLEFEISSGQNPDEPLDLGDIVVRKSNP